MPPKIDLRKKPDASAKPFDLPPAAGATPAGVSGKLPIPVGQVVPKTLTPAEQAVFDSLNIKEGQAVPGNLAQLVKSAQDAAKSENANAPPPVPLGTPPLKVPEAVPLSKLPSAHQQAILTSIQETAEFHKTQQAVEAASAGLEPSVQAAVMAGLQAQQAPQLEDVEIVDDRDSVTYADTGELKTTPTKTTPPARPHLPTYCPHCGWDQEVKETVPVDDADKRSFLAALLGGVNWKKSYSILGGSLEIVCRSLYGSEVDMCFKQAYLELQRGDLPGRPEFSEKVNRYRVMLQLVSLRSTAGMSHILPENIADWAVDSDLNNTPLFAIGEYFYSKVLTSETMYRVVCDEIMKFNRLLSKLEVNVENSDFWTGTVPQA